MTPDAIEKRLSESNYATLQQQDELLAVDIRNPFAKARIFLQGAQLTQFQAKGETDLIWCSPTAEYQAGKAIRGGIPICWPWFGALEKNPGEISSQLDDPDAAPAHGFARQVQWQLDHVQDLDDHTEVKLSYQHRADKHWPFNCLLSVRYQIGKQLKMRFIVSNADSNTFHFSHALHSYFPCEDILQVEVGGLEDCHYIDTLQDWSEQTQLGTVQFCAEVDRIYTDVPARLQIHHAIPQRSIVLESDEHHCAVVWNPWVDKSRRLSGFPDDGYQSMLCVESANVLQHVQTLQPGQTLAYNLSISLV